MRQPQGAFVLALGISAKARGVRFRVVWYRALVPRRQQPLRRTAAERRNPCVLQGFRAMELEGLEPSTSWVRCRGAVLQKLPFCRGFWSAWSLVRGADCRGSPAILGVPGTGHSQCLTRPVPGAVDPDARFTFLDAGASVAVPASRGALPPRAGGPIEVGLPLGGAGEIVPPRRGSGRGQGALTPWDISDHMESRDSLAIPEQLVFALTSGSSS